MDADEILLIEASASSLVATEGLGAIDGGDTRTSTTCTASIEPEDFLINSSMDCRTLARLFGLNCTMSDIRFRMRSSRILAMAGCFFWIKAESGKMLLQYSVRFQP